MQKIINKFLVQAMLLIIFCMVFVFGKGVYAEDTETLIEQVYQFNLEIYNEAPTDQETLQSYLDQEIDEEVRKKALEITAGCTTQWDKMRAIHDWVANNIYYDYYSFARNAVGSCEAKDVVEKRGTVCQGYSNLTADMCNAVGVPCKVVQGYCTSENRWTEAMLVLDMCNHAWNEVYVNGRWVILDVTWDSQSRNTTSSPTPIFQECRHDYFDISLEDFSRTHKMRNFTGVPVDTNTDRKIDPNLKLKITVKDDKIHFDWDEVELGIQYDLLYDIVNGAAFGQSYSIGCNGIIVPHYEEPISLYNNFWPIYFRLRVIKKDGTVWYTEVIEFDPSNVSEEPTTEKPTPDYIVGDANGDGKLSTVDIVLIRQHLAGGYNVTISTDAADVNGDNKVTTVDLVLIRRYIAGGYDVEFKKP